MQPQKLHKTPELTTLTLDDIYAALLLIRKEKEYWAHEEKRMLNELETRYIDKLKLSLTEKDQPFGIVSYEQDGYLVKADFPKKVEWDQERLAEIYKDPQAQEYIEIEYNIPEKKFSAWPVSVQNFFMPARTVTQGNVKFNLLREKE